MSRDRPSRKQARRDALFLLYQRDVTARPVADLVAGHRLREGYPPDEFTVAVVAGVMERQEGLDAALAAHSTNWALARLAPLERSLLRLALYEIESGLTPPEVAIDEAVRLARRYSTDEAGALVNGILGAVVRARGQSDGPVAHERQQGVGPGAYGPEVAQGEAEEAGGEADAGEEERG